MSQTLTQENLKNLLLAELQVIGETDIDGIILVALNDGNSIHPPSFLLLVNNNNDYYSVMKFYRSSGGMPGYWSCADDEEYNLSDAILAFYQEARDFDYRVPSR